MAVVTDDYINKIKAEAEAASSQRSKISKALDDMHSTISKHLQTLSLNFSAKLKNEIVNNLEVQEKALEEKYLEIQRKVNDLQRKYRTRVMFLLENAPKEGAQSGLDSMNATKQLQTQSRTMVKDLLDIYQYDQREERSLNQQKSEFGSWEIDMEEITLGTDVCPKDQAKLGEGKFLFLF